MKAEIERSHPEYNASQVSVSINFAFNNNQEALEKAKEE